jgi:glutaredoxin-like protein
MTLESKEGQRIPEMSFKIRRDNDWSEVSTDDLFKGQTVVVFALPGAFTPTCSASHVPGYNALTPALKDAGVDRVMCLSVNDPFVMDAWAKDQEAENVEFLPDGNGAFSRAMGMLVDKSDLNFGDRSWRYSMLVSDGVIEKMFIEPEQPGDPFDVSDAETMLKFVNPDYRKSVPVTIMTKPGCPQCDQAKRLLQGKGYQYEEIFLGDNGVSFESLTAMTGQRSVPQVFIGGERVGSTNDLREWLSAQAS